jgi:hypothetical protein
MHTGQVDYDYADLQLPADCANTDIKNKVYIPNYNNLFNVNSVNRQVGVGFSKGTTLEQAQSCINWTNANLSISHAYRD